MKHSAWFLALTNPISLLMLVVAAGAGFLYHWWIFPAGLIYWFVMVLTIVHKVKNP